MKSRYCSGTRLLSLVQSGIKHLGLHRSLIDSLNVFPNPDGNTGENMYRTLLAGWGRMHKAPRNHTGALARELFLGAFTGGRGVSGFILAKLFEGFMRSVKETVVLYPEDIVVGLSRAVETACDNIPGPIDGTMLDVARSAARSCATAFSETDRLDAILAAAHSGARDTLMKTPESIPAIKDAGTVDAGGFGLLLFFEGMLLYSFRRPIALNEEYNAFHLRGSPKKTGYRGYCAEFLIKGENDFLEPLRKSLSEVAESIFLLEGEDGFVKVHLLASDPKRVFDRTSRFGRVSNIKVEDIGELEQEFISELSLEQPVSKGVGQ